MFSYTFITSQPFSILHIISTPDDKNAYYTIV